MRLNDPEQPSAGGANARASDARAMRDLKAVAPPRETAGGALADALRRAAEKGRSS